MKKILLIVTLVYGLLYLAFIIFSFIPEQGYDPYDAEGIFVKGLFILFLIGLYGSWKDQLLGAMIFLFWYAAMFYLENFIVGSDGGGGLVMGFPLLILGVLFLLSHLLERHKKKMIL